MINGISSVEQVLVFWVIGFMCGVLGNWVFGLFVMEWGNISL